MWEAGFSGSLQVEINHRNKFTAEDTFLAVTALRIRPYEKVNSRNFWSIFCISF
jgi:hypothetical protein